MSRSALFLARQSTLLRARVLPQIVPSAIAPAQQLLWRNTNQLRPLCSSSRLPTIEEIRAFGKPDLEDARFVLTKVFKSYSVLDDTEKTARGDVARLLAATHLRLGDPIAAEELLDEQRSGLSKESDAWQETTFLLGVCYQKSGREEDAMTMFEEVLADDPEGKHWRARFHVALMAIKEGEYDAAAAMLLEVLEVNPEHAESERLLDKLHERADAEANRLEVPAGPNEINGVHDYEKPPTK